MLRALLAAILLLAPLPAAAQAYGMGVAQVAGGGPNLLYEIRFTNSPPYGTDEVGASTQNCTTHGADSTTATVHNCECFAACNPQLDAIPAYRGQVSTGKTQTKWNAKWTGGADTWFHYFIRIVDNSPSAARILEFRNGAGGDAIGTSGYYIEYVHQLTNQLKIGCDDTTEDWLAAFVSGTVYEWVVHVNTDSGLVEIFVDGNPSAALTCNGTGGDSATPVDGFSFEVEDSDLVLNYDTFQVYDGDPR